MSGKNEEYVVRGATMECSAGNQRAYFYPTSARGTSVGTGTQGIDTDRNPENVVVDFGTCGNIDGENNRCTKSFQWIWQNASTKAFYSAYTKLSHSFHQLYSMYATLMEAHGDGLPTLNTVNDNPAHPLAFYGLLNNNTPEYNTLTEYRDAISQINTDIAQLGLSEEDTGYKNANKQIKNIEQLLENIESEMKYEGQVGKGRLLLDSSVLHCKNDGIISFVENSGQILYANISPYHERILELRQKVREAITAHYAGQDNAAEQSARTIERLNMNDDASANRHYNGKWASHDPESNPYKLLAWIVLLENDSAEKRRKLEEFQEQAGNDELSGVAIFEWDEWQFDDDVFENRYITLIKKDAHKLYPEIPLISPGYSANYGTYEPLYSSHTGVDFIGGVEVYASHSGIINFIVTGVGATTSPSYGNHISINSANNTFMYCHLENSDNGVLVSNDDFVLVGKKIGTKGALSGYGSGPHLHYEVRPLNGAYYSDVDPYNHLPSSIKSKQRFYYA